MSLYAANFNQPGCAAVLVLAKAAKHWEYDLLHSFTDSTVVAHCGGSLPCLYTQHVRCLAESRAS